MVIIKIAIGLVIIVLSFVFLLKSGEDSLLSILMKQKKIGPSKSNKPIKYDDEDNDSFEDSKDKV